MTKLFIATAASAAFVVSGQPAFAQKGHAAKPATAAHAVVKPAPAPHGGTQTHVAAASQPRKAGAGPTAHGQASHATKPTTPTHASQKSASAHGPKPATTGHGAKPSPSSHASTSGKPTHPAKSTASAPSSTTPTGAVPLTPVQQKLQKNTNLASKVQSRLPAGTDLTAASAGFKNLGQFVAAVNVSHNLGIPFDQLKTSMVGNGLSLGQSIQTLKQSANPDVEVHRAELEASVIISESETAPAPKPRKAPKAQPRSGDDSRQ
jgi:hypothetical protein